jgi:ankyrin repeat protein
MTCRAPDHDKLIQNPQDNFKNAVKQGCVHAIKLAIQNVISIEAIQDAMVDTVYNSHFYTFDLVNEPLEAIYCALHYAISNGYIDILDLLNKYGLIQKSSNSELLLDAIQYGHVDVVDWIIQRNNTLLDTCILEGHTPLHFAALMGHVNIINRLVQYESKLLDTLDNDGNTPMHLAAKHGHIAAVETLIGLGSKSIHTFNHDDFTPLHTAIYYRSRDIVDLFVKTYPDTINATNKYGTTPLHLAVELPNLELTTELIKHSAKVDTLDNWQETPLHKAVRRGLIGNVESLLYAGSVATTFQNHSGRTPLHIAIECSRSEIAELLLKFDKQPMYMKDNNGNTPLSTMHTPPNITKKCLLMALVGEQDGFFISEEERLEIRYRLYFSTSLTHRLLYMSSGSN